MFTNGIIAGDVCSGLALSFAGDVAEVVGEKDLFEVSSESVDELFRQKVQVFFPLKTNLSLKLLVSESNVVQLFRGEDVEQSQPGAVVFVAFAELSKHLGGHSQQSLEVAVSVASVAAEGSTPAPDVFGEYALGDFDLVGFVQRLIHVENHSGLLVFWLRGELEYPI